MDKILARFVCVVFVASASAASAAPPVWDESCSRLVVGEKQLNEIFGSHKLGYEIFSYLFLLNQRNESVVASSNFNWVGFDQRMRDEMGLAQMFTSLVKPLLEQYQGNADLTASLDGDDELLALAEDERQALLAQLEHYKSGMVREVYQLVAPETEAPSALVELSRSGRTRATQGVANRLSEMYLGLARRKGWKVEVLEQTDDDVDGLLNLTMRVSGADVYRLLQFERGTHRFIYQTPNGIRHTNYVDVRVYQEPKPLDFTFDLRDVEITTARASGPGGQHVNTTDSAVRVRHRPTGIEVHISNQRSQHRNREVALSILRTKLFNQAQEAAQAEAERIRQAGGDSGVVDPYVRTYNWLYNAAELDTILSGNIEAVLEERLKDDLERRLPDAISKIVNDILALQTPR